MLLLFRGAKIGEGCIIGAGSVVSGIIEKCSILIENPCKVIGQRDYEEYLKLSDKILLKLRKERYNISINETK
jgi:acetyltransferase-like isoleucine patch superfamily enzyme